MTSSLREAATSLACTSTSCCVADGLCLPLDFLKTRLQLQNELVSASAERLGPVGMAEKVARTEGALAFYDGLPAAMLRQATYGGMCFASYPYLRDTFADAAGTSPQQAPIWVRIAAGAVAGGAASAIANPTDVVKVRIQADGRQALLGQAPRYAGCLDAVRPAADAARMRSSRAADGPLSACRCGPFGTRRGRPRSIAASCQMCSGLAWSTGRASLRTTSRSRPRSAPWFARLGATWERHH